jgi:hypothetical protein
MSSEPPVPEQLESRVRRPSHRRVPFEHGRLRRRPPRQGRRRDRPSETELERWRMAAHRAAEAAARRGVGVRRGGHGPLDPRRRAQVRSVGGGARFEAPGRLWRSRAGTGRRGTRRLSTTPHGGLRRDQSGIAPWMAIPSILFYSAQQTAGVHGPRLLPGGELAFRVVKAGGWVRGREIAAASREPSNQDGRWLQNACTEELELNAIVRRVHIGISAADADAAVLLLIARPFCTPSAHSEPDTVSPERTQTF